MSSFTVATLKQLLLLSTVSYISIANIVLAPGTCKYLGSSTEERLVNPCVFAVNYPYFHPTGTSDLQLLERVNASLNSTAILNYPKACQSALIRYACADVYLKCPDGIDLTNTSTYNYQIYQNDTHTRYPLPIMRPCEYICSQISSVCTGLYKVTNSAKNCFVKHDYSNGNSTAPFPYKYDLSNDNKTFCFAPVLTDVSGPEESYQLNSSSGTSSPCSGFVDTFYIPAGNKINTSYTLIQMPFALQTLLNEKLLAKLNRLLWLDESCHLSLMKYFCYSTFLRSEGITIQRAFDETPRVPALSAYQKVAYASVLSQSVDVPQYPNRSIWKIINQGVAV